MSNIQVLTVAIMSSANEVRGAEQKGVKYCIGELVPVGCSFTKCTDTYCVRLSDFFASKEEAEEAKLMDRIVVERGPLVVEDKLQYYPSKNCLSPINQWVMEKRFNKRIR